MGIPIDQEIKDEILRELERNEFRAGEFYHTLAERFGVSAWTVRRLAEREKMLRREGV